jgi:hypothetical protein
MKRLIPYLLNPYPNYLTYDKEHHRICIAMLHLTDFFL